MLLNAFIAEVMEILKNNPDTDEILVKNVLPLREVSYQGKQHYDELFKQRNDMFLQARKAEWDQLAS